MFLLFNILFRLYIAFLPRSKCLLISWLQSPSTVILGPPKIKSLTVSIVSSSICHEVMGPDAMIFILFCFRESIPCLHLFPINLFILEELCALWSFWFLCPPMHSGGRLQRVRAVIHKPIFLLNNHNNTYRLFNLYLPIQYINAHLLKSRWKSSRLPFSWRRCDLCSSKYIGSGIKYQCYTPLFRTNSVLEQSWINE